MESENNLYLHAMNCIFYKTDISNLDSSYQMLQKVYNYECLENVMVTRESMKPGTTYRTDDIMQFFNSYIAGRSRAAFRLS